MIGPNGFVGSAIGKELKKNPKIDVIEVTRKDNLEAKVKYCNVIVHSACTGRRFWANSNPHEDRQNSVYFTKKLVEICTNQKLILISSLSARIQPETFYGQNRRACEILVSQKPSNLIIRMGPMLDITKLNGPILDIIHSRKVFMSEESKLALVLLSYNAKKVVELLDKTGLIELGARDSVSMAELKERYNSTSEFEGREDTQIPNLPPSDAPSVKEAFDEFEKIYFRELP